MKAYARNRFYSLEGKPCITFEVADAEMLNSEILDGRELDLAVKEYRRKRSLSANAYMWALIGEIATAMRISTSEVYHRMLCDYGTLEKTDGVLEIITIKSDIKPQDWLYTHTRPIKTVELDGKMFTHYAVIKGSSRYDTKEMTALLDGVIYEAKELGIETLTPDEIARLKGYEINHTA